MWPFKGKSKGEKIQVCEVAINTKTTNTKLDDFRIRRMQWTTRTTRSSRQKKTKKRPRRKLRRRMVVTLPTLCTISPNNWTWPKRHRWDEQVCLPYFGEIDKAYLPLIHLFFGFAPVQPSIFKDRKTQWAVSGELLNCSDYDHHSPGSSSSSSRSPSRLTITTTRPSWVRTCSGWLARSWKSKTSLLLSEKNRDSSRWVVPAWWW